MSVRKLRLVLLGLLAGLTIGFMAVMAGGLTILSAKSHELVDLKLQNKTVDAQLTNLELSKKNVEQYAYFKNVAKTVIPSDKDQAASILEIFQIAEQSGISLQSVTFPSSTLGAARAVDAANAANTPTIISQALPVSGIPNLYSVQLIITPQSGPQLPQDRQVTYAKMLDFLKRIENNRRTAQITNVNIQTGNSGGAINFTLNINIFIKP